MKTNLLAVLKEVEQLQCFHADDVSQEEAELHVKVRELIPAASELLYALDQVSRIAANLAAQFSEQLPAILRERYEIDLGNARTAIAKAKGLQ